MADSLIVRTRALHLCSPARAHDQYTRLPISLFLVKVKSPTFNLRLPRQPSMYKNKSEMAEYSLDSIKFNYIKKKTIQLETSKFDRLKSKI